jgi:hypothetical protein
MGRAKATAIFRDLFRRRQARELLANGLFDLPWYLRRNPDLRPAGLQSVLRWLDSGWRQGRDPHPLFAVEWYLAQNPEVATRGDNPLLHYLERGWREGCEPCPLFDSAWYFQLHPDAREAGIDPLSHFIARGVAAGYEPSPLLQTPLYLESCYPGGTPAEALRHFAESGLAFAPGAYRSFDVLSSLQRQYRARTSMRRLRDERGDARRFAVYLQCGAGSVHARWLSGADRDWDLIVNHYDPTYAGRVPCDVEFQQVGGLPGTKFTSFHTLLSDWPDLVGAYDYLLLLDDDICLDEPDLSTLFGVVAEAGLDLAQPGLSAGSHGCHGVFRSRGGTGLRYVNGVEIMMPVISRGALRVGGHLFAETISGWGLDLALARLVRERAGGRAAIVDDIVVEHTKPIDLEGGQFYRMLMRENIYPMLEYACLTKTYGCDSTFYEL